MCVKATVQPLNLIIFHAARNEGLRVNFISVKWLLVLWSPKDQWHTSLFGHRDGVVDPQFDILILNAIVATTSQRRNPFVPLLITPILFITISLFRILFFNIYFGITPSG